jgi:hypothetical protein
MKFGIGIVIVLGVVVWATSSAQSSRSVRDGVYTVQQARRGAARSGLCAPCHGADLEGDTAPPLTGAAFTAKWNGKTVGDLFEIISKDMPNDDPGSLTRRQSADYLAYILLANELPAGKVELPIDAEILNQIRFEAQEAR